MAPVFTAPGEFVSRTKPSVCCASRATRPDLLLRHGEVLGGICRVLARQVKQVHHRLERIIDLVRDRSREPPSGCEFLTASNRFFRLLFRRHIPRDRRRSHDSPTRVTQRRDRQKNRHTRPIFSKTLGRIRIDIAAFIENPSIAFSFLLTLRGRESSAEQADSLLARVSEKMLGRAIPAGDCALRIGAENGVAGIFHNGGHLADRALRPRFSKRSLPRHAARENRDRQKYQHLLRVRLRQRAR